MFNALDSVSSHFSIDTITDLILDGYSFFSQLFLAALIQAIEQYEMAHIACLATKCLACLLRVCPELREEEALRENALVLLRSLKDTQSYGHDCHLGLESEATNVISIMRTACVTYHMVILPYGDKSNIGASIWGFPPYRRITI